MTQRDAASAGAEVTIDADADTVYGLITDLPTLASLAEETNAMEWRKGDSARARRGVQGSQPQRHASRWTTTCTVTDAEPGRVFAFDVTQPGAPGRALALRHRTRRRGGCPVTERTWDRRPGWFRKTAGSATGVRDRDAANAEHIRLTLERD